jgi:hypothetical protein
MVLDTTESAIVKAAFPIVTNLQDQVLYRKWRWVMLQYKVIELSNVTEETIEEALNEKVAEGWSFDGMQFAMRESSKRPAMAFLLFTREEEA